MTLLASGWFSPSERVPRKDQVVRISTGAVTSHAARFVVEHTQDWPSGASWALTNGHRIVPFTEVLAWSPDVGTTASAFASRSTIPADAAALDRRERERRERDRRMPDAVPAIVSELVTELGRADTLLRRLPPEQLDWSPHPDLPSLRALAHRLLRIVARVRWMIELDSVESSFEPDLPGADSLADLIDTFHASAASASDIAAALTGAALRETWTLERDNEPVVQTARGDALREFGLRPLVYHQAEIALLLVSMSLPVSHPYGRWPFAEASPRPWTV